jgi:hypothetical protein
VADVLPGTQAPWSLRRRLVRVALMVAGLTGLVLLGVDDTSPSRRSPAPATVVVPPSPVPPQPAPTTVVAVPITLGP